MAFRNRAEPWMAEPEPHRDVSRRVSESHPHLLACTKAKHVEMGNGVQKGYFNPDKTNSVVQQEVRPGGRDGLGAGLLPGSDHHIGYTVALAGELTFSERLAVQASTKVIQ